MPPTQMDFSALSDDELSQMLKDYNIDVGPVNLATRSTYERKLYRLKTGQVSPPSQKYEPVDDDDDDEVELRVPATSTPAGRTTPSSIPVPTQVRSRQVLDHSSTGTVDSRPSLYSAGRGTRESFPTRPIVRQPPPAKLETSEADSKGIPLWVKLFGLFVVALLVYLIYTNMEPQAVSNIPSIPNKVEV